MATITINGITFSGNNISMVNNRVYIDGVEQHPKDNPPQIYITVEGNVNSVQLGQVQECKITGDVGDITTGQGDIKVEGNINGSCKTGQGNINAINIVGNCKTGMGNIKYVQK